MVLKAYYIYYIYIYIILHYTTLNYVILCYIIVLSMYKNAKKYKLTVRK